jgi:hypothetical protein
MDTTLTFVIIGIVVLVTLVWLSNLRNEGKSKKGREEKKRDYPHSKGLAESKPTSNEIVKRQNADKEKGPRKGIYLVCGLVIAVIAGYGAAMLGSNIEDGICSIMHNDFGYPKQFYNDFILCGAVNKEPFFTTGVIVFVIVSLIAFKAVGRMRP